MLQLPPPFANTPGLSRETISEYDDAGPAWAWKTLTVGEHVGTHFDAPIHWITGRDGEDVASAPRVQARRALRGDRQVRRGGRRPELPADARGHPGVGERARRAARRAAGCSCARAGTPAPTTRPRSSTAARRPARTSSAARYLAERAPIVGFGCETVGTDAGLAHAFDPAFPVHHLLLGAGKYGLTQLANLAELPPHGRDRDRRAAQARRRHRLPEPGVRAYLSRRSRSGAGSNPCSASQPAAPPWRSSRTSSTRSRYSGRGMRWSSGMPSRSRR